MKNYSKPVIRDRGGDLGKAWFVEYYYRHPETGSMQRFQVAAGINRRPKLPPGTKPADAERIHLRARRERAQALRDALLEDLKAGFSPFLARSIAIAESANQHDGLVAGLKAMASVTGNNRARTVASYTTAVNQLDLWLRQQGMAQIAATQWTLTLAMRFSVWLQGRVNGTTHNNYLTFLQRLTHLLIAQGAQIVNVWREVPHLREEEGGRLGFEPDQAAKLLPAIEQQDPDLYLFVLHVYLCLLRPAEVRRLRIENYDLKRGLLHVAGTQSKNRRYMSVTIPAVLLKLLKARRIDQCPGSWRLFGENLRPGLKPCGENHPNNRHNAVLQRQNYKGGETLYSWKDTGAIAFVEGFKGRDTKPGDILLHLMRQCRHSSPEVTMRYLKRLGLDASTAFVDFDPLPKKKPAE